MQKPDGEEEVMFNTYVNVMETKTSNERKEASA